MTNVWISPPSILISSCLQSSAGDSHVYQGWEPQVCDDLLHQDTSCEQVGALLTIILHKLGPSSAAWDAWSPCFNLERRLRIVFEVCVMILDFCFSFLCGFKHWHFYSITEDYRRVLWIWFWILFPTAPLFFFHASPSAFWKRRGSQAPRIPILLHLSPPSLGRGSPSCHVLGNGGQRALGWTQQSFLSLSFLVCNMWSGWAALNVVVGISRGPLTHPAGGTSGQQKAECRPLLLPRGARPLPWAMVFPANSMSLVGDNLLILLEMTDGNSCIV